MGIIKILCLFCLCSVPECFVYWEDLNNDEKAKITNSQTLPPIVKSYYNGEAHLTDDDNTFEYLNVLSEPKNAEQKMLYLYLLNSICLHSDGALAEALGQYCIKLLFHDPDYVLTYILKDEESSDMYATNIGYELAMSDDPEEAYTHFSKKLTNEILKVPKVKSDSFLSLVYSSLKQAID